MPIYGSTDGGDTYFTTRLDSDDWDEATDSDKLAALTMATESIDNLNYIGDLTDENQVNQFPRGTDSSVPDEIITATYDIAIILLSGFDIEIETENLWLKERRYAQAKSTYDTSIASPYILAGIASSTAWRKLVPYLRDPSDIRLNRVT